jgi:multicomponent Na+:H+ antiporter subunit E
MKATLMIYLKRWPYFLTMLGLWFAFHLSFDLKTLLAGLVASVGMTVFTSSVVYDDRGFKFQGLSLWTLIKYFFVLLFEIFKSAWSYVFTIFSRDFHVVVFDLKLSFIDPLKVAFVANSITLTPGTVSVDVNNDTITVMAFVKKGTSQADIEKPIRQRFENLLKEKRR